MTVSFHLGMDDSTFGVCRLQVDEDVCEIDFSDTTDAIGDLVRAAAHIAMGEGFANVFFEREPGMWIWELMFGLDSRTPGLEVSVFDDQTTDVDGRPALIFRARCDKDEFGRAILAEVDRLTNELEPKAYEALFQQVIPRRSMAALRAALDAVDPERTPLDLEGSIVIRFLPDPDAEPIDVDAALEWRRHWFRKWGGGIDMNWTQA